MHAISTILRRFHEVRRSSEVRTVRDYSTLARKCESEGVERVFAVVEYIEPLLQSFRENRDDIRVRLQRVFEICESRAIAHRRREH